MPGSQPDSQRILVSIQSRCGEPLAHPQILARHLLIGLEARTLRQAFEIDPRKADAVPSTKGVLGGTL